MKSDAQNKAHQLWKIGTCIDEIGRASSHGPDENFYQAMAYLAPMATLPALLGVCLSTGVVDLLDEMEGWLAVAATGGFLLALGLMPWGVWCVASRLAKRHAAKKPSWEMTLTQLMQDYQPVNVDAWNRMVGEDRQRYVSVAEIEDWLPQEKRSLEAAVERKARTAISLDPKTAEGSAQ